MQIGDRVLFTDEAEEEIREVTISGITIPEDDGKGGKLPKAGFAYVINDDEGNEWIVDPSEVEEMEDE